MPVRGNTDKPTSCGQLIQPSLDETRLQLFETLHNEQISFISIEFVQSNED